MTYRRQEGEVDTLPPEGFHYLTENMKKGMDNGPNMFPPPPSPPNSDYNPPPLGGDNNLSSPPPPGNIPPPSNPPGGDNKSGQDKPPIEQEKPLIILSQTEHALAQQGGLDNSEAASSLQNTYDFTI